MRRRVLVTVICGMAVAAMEEPAWAAENTPQHDQEVLKVLGKQEDCNDRVLKVNIPRNDLKVTVVGLPTPMAFGFGGWVAMTQGDHGMDVAMDYRVLVENEVNPVLKALRHHNLDVVAIHQHMFGTQPQIIFLHDWGTGPAEQLAQGFNAALTELGRSRQPQRAMSHEAGAQAH